MCVCVYRWEGEFPRPLQNGFTKNERHPMFDTETINQN